MKKRILSLFLTVAVMFFFVSDGRSQTTTERKASESNILALFDFYDDFHRDFLAAAKVDIDNNDNTYTAIKQDLDKYIGMYGLLDGNRVFAPDNAWAAGIPNVLTELANLYGASRGTAKVIDTGDFTLSNGGTARLIIGLYLESLGGGHDKKANVAKHYKLNVNLPYTAPDGMVVNVTANYRDFFETNTNDITFSYTAYKDGMLIGTASIQGYVAAGTLIVNKTTHTKYVANNTITYSHTGPYTLTRADTANLAFFTGGASNTIASVSGAYLSHNTCPPAPPCNNFLTVTNADGQPVHTVAIGDTVTFKADFSTFDGVKSVFVVAFPLVEGNDDPGTIGAVNGSVFEQTIAIPKTAPVGQVILMAVAFDAEYVIKDGEPSPAGKALASATYLLEITEISTAPVLTVTYVDTNNNTITVKEGASIDRATILNNVIDISADLTSFGVTSSTVSLIDSTGKSVVLGTGGATVTATLSTTFNDLLAGSYTIRVDGTGGDTRDVSEELHLTIIDQQIP